MRPNLPILAIAILANTPQLLDVYQWFNSTTATWLQDVGADANARRFATRYVAENPRFHQSLTALLRQADTGIREMAVREDVVITLGRDEQVPPSSELDPVQSSRRQKYVAFRHGDMDETRHTPLFSIEEESRGTQQLFVLGVLLLEGLANGQVLIIDELDTSMHPQLVRALVQLFHAENQKNAQLIFNTHDASLLRGELFDRDQIWFAEKDREGASRLYALLEFKAEEGEDIERGYLNGRFGAVPLLDFFTWQELRPDAAS